MQRLLIIFLFFSFSNAGFAQKELVSSKLLVSGKIIDAVSKQPIEYASIVLTNDSTHKIIDGGITDKKGNFNLQNAIKGNHTLTIQFIGYTDYSEKIIVTKNTTLSTILLNKKNTKLTEVTVVGTRQLIENKIDKLVYNLEKDLTSQGGVASDALKKIPMITVDADGKVELLGNPNVRFLIDGKPSGIFGNSVADALQSIPNSQIQSIEVITSPSAKYDAAGSGGIINIVLKKNKLQGFNGNTNLSAGTRLETGSLNLSLKEKNIGFNTFFSGNAQLTGATPTGMDRLTTLSTGNRRLLQESATNFGRNGYKAGAGMDLTLSKTESLTASYSAHHFAYNNNGATDQTFIQYDLNGNTNSLSNSIRDFTNNTSVNETDNSLVYLKKFKNEKKTLEIAYNGSFTNISTYYNQAQHYKNIASNFSAANSLNLGKENEVEFSINYTYPVSEEFFIETGAKYTNQHINSNADVNVLNANTFIKDPYQSYVSIYKRNIYAGYVSAEFELFKLLNIKTGIRYENTQSDANYSNAAYVTLPDYRNIAPSFIASHNFPNKQVVKFAYSYRIERPDFRDLNPFMNLSDPHNITTGNPNLQPEIGNNFELGYNKTYENGSNLNILISAQKNSPDIKPFVSYAPSLKIGDSIFTDVTLTSRANISEEIRAGINISASLLFGKKINIRPNIMVYNRYMKNIYDDPAVVNSLGIKSSINFNYTFNNDWIAEAFGNYYLGSTWQGKQPSMFSYTFAARKQLFNSKGSIGLVMVNCFSKYLDQKTLIQTKNLITNSYRDIPYRSFGISFTYKFGKLKFGKTKESDNYLYAPPSENN
ncbi:MAG: TonB-dependent receptor [Sediminibacterium sp.]